MSDLDRLKQILLAEEREKLQRAEQRVAELEQKNRELSALLPALVRAAPQEPMTRALASPVAAALGSAVRDNRNSIVDALFPVIGPIIRKAIAEALRGLMSDLNRVLEYGFSPRGVRWRIEAWRSGVPFAQIVLRHTLRYGIDHVFLIERDSGLVLHRQSSPGLPDLDADAIAGMLTAIGEFVRDSVGRDGGDSLEAARVGDHLLWVLDGPRVSLACFITGVPPNSLRAVLSDRLEQIHAQLPADARSEPAAEWETALNPAAIIAASAELNDRDGAPASKRASRWPLIFVLVLVLGALAWYFVRIERWNARVDAVRTALVAHPGFLLGQIDSRPWKALAIHGLLDADAEPIEPLLGAVDLGGVEPELKLDGYLSTADAVLLRRARRLLRPPDGVGLSVDRGVLGVTGVADAAWVEAGRSQAPWIAGLHGVEWRVSARVEETPDPQLEARTAARAELGTLAEALAADRAEFVDDLDPDADGAAFAGRAVAAITRARQLAERAGVALRLRIIGHTDSSGTEEINRRLRVQRADWLRDRLREAGVPATLLQESRMDEVAGQGASTFRGASVELVVAEPQP
ncbi:hypothetical protein [Dokdonella immobilis]|uniref:Outer membrane protein OmpA n=1 Tax=Dokdonella immobilis TaxID=578942 RepID=A0A1I4WCC8_9GAMM|nr:hypothetical protein [Dokdonella immobilis]SFN11298.1 hypothetical protein SAMN05216289_104181 [Dokdonella immobilis]